MSSILKFQDLEDGVWYKTSSGNKVICQVKFETHNFLLGPPKVFFEKLLYWEDVLSGQLVSYPVVPLETYKTWEENQNS